ncbi:MAG: LytR C-terminal domain-containing protein [Aeromicrobium sp.]|uniref:LytR C-terminal domain-containing protein n=1 Tax=Aeromicrobium sp. TaxID=1871063 RepID=UPI003C3683B5
MPAAWFIIFSVVACVGAAGWLGFLLVDPAPASAGDAQAASTPRPAAPASPAETTPTPSPTATTSTTPTVKREALVAVLNNTTIRNLARSFSAKVAAAGWTVSGTGNWRGQIEANTVYYPGGLQDQAELLATDVGISRVLPSIVPMRMDRLTLILSGPQQ